jgi:chloramphenicol-sensitive protein RarD
MTSNKQSSLISFLYAVLAYGCWGFFPLYWKQLDAVGSHELIIWRIIITFLTLWFVMLLSGKQMIKDYFETLFSLKKIKILGTTGFLIVSNWGIYIWAVNNGHIVDASMGYFMTPILNIVL